MTTCIGFHGPQAMVNVNHAYSNSALIGSLNLGLQLLSHFCKWINILQFSPGIEASFSLNASPEVPRSQSSWLRAGQLHAF